MPKPAIEIVESLIDTPHEDREAALELACEGAARLMAEVRELLALDEDASGFLEPTGRALAAQWDEPTPERVGPYRIVERVGEGGFGIVYKAEQSEPIARTVALKVLKRGMDSVSVLRRFELERQTLAMIEHPNVARMLDSGMIPEEQPGAGRPYFAMEFVEGAPITSYARERGLDTEARVRLLLQACAAAQHAHAKGVIHRDLKPSNILVTEVDGEPVCKVIDFGIAKALGGEQIGATLMTNPGAMIGTPQYMSPEQARGSADIDTRSDVYSLGVVLYELLAGVAPFDLRAAKTTDLERLRRLITEIEPQTPSSRIAQASRETSQDGIRSASDAGRRVRGDLDWITMRAIAKERGRRYATVAALADDLTRFLGSRPVDAGPPSAWYRVSKFVRRNRAGVSAAGVALALLIGGLVGTSYGLVQAQRAEADARRSAETAEREAATATAINDFLNEDLLSSVDPGRTENRDITMREVLGLASTRLDGRFGEQPLVEAAIRRTVAQMLERVGDPAQAEQHRRRELELLTAQLGPTDEQTAEATQSLATNLLEQGRFQDGIELTRDLLAMLREHREPNDEQIVRAVSNLGAALLQVGGFAEAKPLMAESLDAKRRTLGEDNPSTLTSIHNLAGLYGSTGEPARAVEFARQAFEGRRRVLGRGDPRTYSSLHLLTWALMQNKQYDEAKAIVLENLEGAQTRLGPEHPRVLAMVESLADAHFFLGELEASATRHNESWMIRSATVGPTHPSALRRRIVYATVLSELDLYDVSIAVFDEVLTDEQAPELIPPLIRYPWLKSYGDTLRRTGDLPRAESVLQQAWAIVSSIEDPSQNAAFNVASSMVALYSAWDKLEPEAGHAERVDEWQATLDQIDED